MGFKEFWIYSVDVFIEKYDFFIIYCLICKCYIILRDRILGGFVDNVYLCLIGWFIFVSVVCLEFFGVWVDLLELGFYDLLICCSCVFVRIIFDFVCYFL